MPHMVCRHIKTNGLQCQSPAVKGRPFCYYHSKTHTISDDVKFGPLVLPIPEDPAAIQISIARINEAVLQGRLDLKKAQFLLAGLKLAARFIDPRKYFYAARTVQVVESDERGNDYAPQTLVCGEDDKCEDCPYADRCPSHPGNSRDHEKEENDEKHENKEESILPGLQAQATARTIVAQSGCISTKAAMVRCEKARCQHPRATTVGKLRADG